MENRYQQPDATKKGKWPLCELRVVYKCQLCDSEHVAIARTRGSNMDQNLAKEFLKIVKVDLINKFFQEHPKAKVEEFVIGLVTGVESITYEQGANPETDSIGIPWVTYDIEKITGRKASIDEEKDEKKESGKKGKEELPADSVGINKINEKSPLKDLEKMSFADLTADGMERQFRKRLKEVQERIQQLNVEVMLLSNEEEKLKAMVEAAASVERVIKEKVKSE